MVQSASGWERFTRDLGLRIQRERNARHQTQDEVAARAGISRVTYQRLEHGHGTQSTLANPNLSTLIAVSQVLGVTVADLLPPDPPDLTLN
ncbi:MAG: helix-turn-helix domain-containing protein [Microbacteriaceae bacterium]|jgi:transcriptional regulator with XRE-family HTH domain|nr:helix-turn-helix domain-containing protein [Microbacteriaceae bacterium]MCI1206659.1 helix-turn-helix domain-containing protein [Microbacteriaceae bacterium]